MKKIAIVTSDDGSEKAENPGTVSLVNSGNNEQFIQAKNLLVTILCNKNHVVKFSYRKVKKTQNNTIRVHFNCYHDAAIVADYINSNPE